MERIMLRTLVILAALLFGASVSHARSCLFDVAEGQLKINFVVGLDAASSATSITGTL